MSRRVQSANVRETLKKRGAVLVAALLCLCTVAFGGEEPVTAYAKLPLANRFRNRSWTPLTAVVTNRSAKSGDVTVRFTHTVGDRDGQSVSFSRMVWVPARATREVDLSIYFDMSRDDIMARFEGRGNQNQTAQEEKTTYADGVAVAREKLPMPKPVELDIELHKDGFPAAKPDLFLAVPLHPDAFNLLSVEGMGEYVAPSGILKRIDGLDRVRGELDESTLVAPADLRTFTNANLPPKAILDNRTAVPGTIPSIDVLPRTWAAYQGIDTLILGAAVSSSGEMDAMQRTALLEWVISGGRLVIMPSGTQDGFAHPFFRKLLPVRLGRDRRVDTLTPLTARYGGECPVAPSSEMLAATALPGTGEVVIRDGERVLLAKRQVGRGTVWFSALRGEQVEKWRQNLLLTGEMLWPDASPAPGVRDAWPDAVQSLVEQVVGAAAPSRAVVILILGGYAAACVALLILFRVWGRTELAWPLAMVLALVALAAALGYGNSVRSETGFVQGELGVSVMGDRQGKASSLGYVSVFPGMQPIHADARFENPSTLATASTAGRADTARGMSLSSLNVDQADRFYLRGLSIKGGELFTCNTMTLTDYAAGIDLDFGYDEKGFRGSVTNNTGVPLEDCVFVANRRLVRIGDMAAGASVDLAKLAPVAADELVTRLSSREYQTNEEEQTRARMLGLLRRFPVTEGTRSRYDWPPAFYGWARRPLAYVTFGENDKPVQRSLQLLTLSADTVNVKPGSTVLVPAGACGLQFAQSTSRRAFGVPLMPRFAARMAMGGAPAVTPGGRKMPAAAVPMPMPGYGGADRPVDPEARFVMPMWLPGEGPLTGVQVGFLRPKGLEDLKVTKARVVMSFRAEDFVPDVKIRKGGSSDKWTKIDMKGGSVAEIPNAASYIGRNGELPELQLDAAFDAQKQRGLSMAAWQIKALDLELEGTVPASRAAVPLPPMDRAAIGQ